MYSILGWIIAGRFCHRPTFPKSRTQRPLFRAEVPLPHLRIGLKEHRIHAVAITVDAAHDVARMTVTTRALNPPAAELYTNGDGFALLQRIEQRLLRAIFVTRRQPVEQLLEGADAARMEPLSAPRSSPSSAVIGSVKMSSTTRRCVTSDASSSCRAAAARAHLLRLAQPLAGGGQLDGTPDHPLDGFELLAPGGAIDPIEQLDELIHLGGFERSLIEYGAALSLPKPPKPCEPIDPLLTPAQTR